MLNCSLKNSSWSFRRFTASAVRIPKAELLAHYSHISPVTMSNDRSAPALAFHEHCMFVYLWFQIGLPLFFTDHTLLALVCQIGSDCHVVLSQNKLTRDNPEAACTACSLLITAHVLASGCRKSVHTDPTVNTQHIELVRMNHRMGLYLWHVYDQCNAGFMFRKQFGFFYTEIMFHFFFFLNPFFSELVFGVLKLHDHWHVNINRSWMENNSLHVFRLDIRPMSGYMWEKKNPFFFLRLLSTEIWKKK